MEPQAMPVIAYKISVQPAAKAAANADSKPSVERIVVPTSANADAEPPLRLRLVVGGEDPAK
jgi:hypothetical protein